jgi:hypothetical protein
MPIYTDPNAYEDSIQAAYASIPVPNYAVLRQQQIDDICLLFDTSTSDRRRALERHFNLDLNELDGACTFVPGGTGSVFGINLGTAGPFGAVTPAAFTSTGASVFRGDTASVSYAFDVSGNHIGTSFTPAVQAVYDDVLIAYQDAQSRTATDVLAASLSGVTVKTGVHYSAAAVGTTAGTTFTIDAEGDTNAVFIFQVGGILSIGANTQMLLINNAQPENIFWQVNGGVGIGANSYFKGTILANGAIASGLSTNVEGRLLTRVGAVSVNNNDLTSN